MQWGPAERGKGRREENQTGLGFGSYRTLEPLGASVFSLSNMEATTVLKAGGRSDLTYTVKETSASYIKNRLGWRKVPFFSFRNTLKINK